MGVVAHELGRVLAPVPFVTSAVLATGLLLDANAADPDARLSGLLSGRRTAAAAITGDGGLWSRAAVTLNATRSGDDWRIDGTVRHVLNGTAADDSSVVAAIDREPAVFLLDRTAAGVTVVAERVLDGTRPMATITCAGAPATSMTGEGPADDFISATSIWPWPSCRQSRWERASGCWKIATDYARTREQFDRPIGSFQAIKHKCADMLVDLEWARSASQAALQALDSRNSESRWRASMAKAVCSESLRNAAHANVQIHGGIGFTWEDSAHLYLRRARTDEVLFGTPWDSTGTG